MCGDVKPASVGLRRIDASIATSRLRDVGFKDVNRLEGAFEARHKAGHPAKSKPPIPSELP
jgi:hypothetical protein